MRCSFTPSILLTSLVLTLAVAAPAQQFSVGAQGSDGMISGVSTQLGAMGEVIDFEGYPAGTVLTSVNGDKGTGPILVFGINPDLDGFANLNNAVIFDTNAPTGGDFDLGTPNQGFGGPGVGSGGAPGGPFPNMDFQNNVLIIDESLVDANGDGLIDNPDDAALDLGGILALGFTPVGPVTIHSITIIDVEGTRAPAFVQFLDAFLTPIASVTVLPQTGNNGVAVVDLGGVSGVSYMVVTLNGSGAIDNIVFERDCGGAIGNYVWIDEDMDGTQDAGEPGIQGVTLTLSDGMGNPLATTVTGPAGFYQFTDLCAGDYIVTVVESTLPPGLVPTFNMVGGPTTDSNGSPALVNLPTDFSIDPTIDFGYFTPCTGSIGDFIWNDLNRDGIQDAGEPGIMGVIVNLLDNSGATIGTTTTDRNGFYEFPGLCAGTYTVAVDESTLPPDFVPSPCNAGTNDTVDNDCSPVVVVLPTDDSNDPTVDFGYNSPCTGTIGDFIWDDLDRDGLQDAGEPGIENVTIELKDDQGNVIATTATDLNGFYQFMGLCAGDYTLCVDETTLPPDYVPSPCNVGGDDSIDNDCSPKDVTLPDDNTELDTCDFGYNSPCTGTIGDFIWNDLDRDGIQGAGEPGIEGVVVQLKDDQGTIIAMVTTGPGGSYQFGGLCAGDYTLCVDETTLPPDFVPSPCNVGMNDAIDNDCSPKDVTLFDDNTNIDTCDFGYNSPCTGTIGDFVWEDLNRNGIQDGGEPGIEGVTVILKDAQNVTIATTTTAADGSYQFMGLCAGDYTVEIDPNTLPPGVVPSPCNVGADDTVDNDCSPAGVTLPTDNSDDDTIDFGYNTPCTGTIGDFVWNDLDRDGIQDPGEPGIEGVVVFLSDGVGQISTTTNADGFYQFTGLCAGDYLVMVDEGSLPPGVVPSPCNAGSDDTVDNDCSPVMVNLPTDNAQDPTIDFGYNEPCDGSIGDFVWLDLDRDGLQDAGEPGIEGVPVTLKDDQGNVIATVLTDADGLYVFQGLCAGDYTLCVDPPPGTTPSPCDVGTDDTIDNDCSPKDVNLPTDNTDLDSCDFGFSPPCTGAIGDFVWEDLNGNNVQDVGEPGIEGVVVILMDDMGNVLGMTTTDANGFYLFSGLCAGTYVVSYDPDTVPAGLEAVICDAGGDDALDSDCSPVTVVLPTDDSTDDTIDFGFGPCGECDGKVNALTLQYLGGASANIVVEDKNGNVVFSDSLAPNETFSVFPFPGEAHFDNEVKIFIDGVLDAQIHTSCSQPIGPGLVFGEFLVVAASSVNGGLICDLSDDCCTDGRPAQLTFIYTGQDCNASMNDQGSNATCSGDPMMAPQVLITAFKDAGTVYFSGPVDLGMEFTIDAGFAGDNELASNTMFEITDLAGNVLQELEVHTSCSKPLFVGDQFGSLLLTGCSTQSSIVDECDGQNKPQILSLQYTGEDCTATSTAQDPDKVNCDGDPAFAAQVQIVAFNGNDVYFDDIVDLGTTFDVDATMAGQNDFSSATFFEIYDLSGNLLQEIEFHTSCSQPLILGDQFGSLILVGYTPEP